MDFEETDLRVPFLWSRKEDKCLFLVRSKSICTTAMLKQIIKSIERCLKGDEVYN